MTEPQVATLGATGCGQVRITAGWTTTNFDVIDRRLRLICKYGMRPLISIGNGTLTDAGMAVNIAALVNRYKPTGSFWPANPTIPTKPVDYILGNEPTWSGHEFPGTATDFGIAVNAAAKVIKSIQPDARIYIGGSQASSSAIAYHATAINAIKARLGMGKFFGVGYHAYRSTSADATAAGVLEMRQMLINKGLSDRYIIIDECGYRASDVGGEATKAGMLADFFQQMLYRKNTWLISRVMWYGYHDTSGATPGTLDYDGGLWQPDLVTPRPAWTNFQLYADYTPKLYTSGRLVGV